MSPTKHSGSRPPRQTDGPGQASANPSCGQPTTDHRHQEDTVRWLRGRLVSNWPATEPAPADTSPEGQALAQADVAGSRSPPRRGLARSNTRELDSTETGTSLLHRDTRRAAANVADFGDQTAIG